MRRPTIEGRHVAHTTAAAPTQEVRAERSAEIRHKEAKRNRENPLACIATPCGITYWHRVTVKTGEQPALRQPERRPLAGLDNELDNEEIVHLLSQVKWHVKKRGLVVDWDSLPGATPSGVMVCD